MKLKKITNLIDNSLIFKKMRSFYDSFLQLFDFFLIILQYYTPLNLKPLKLFNNEPTITPKILLNRFHFQALIVILVIFRETI